jgi:hypothetical protein
MCLQSFSRGNSLPPLSVYLTEILEDLGGIHSALAGFFLDQRQIVTDKI